MAIVHTDPFSQAPVYIRLCFGDTELAVATAFIYRVGDTFYLVSNWHCFAGRNPCTTAPLSTKTAAIPDTVACYLTLNGVYIAREWHTALLSKDDVSFWYEHPKHGRNIDIGVLPLALPERFKAMPINDMPDDKLRLRVSDDVFVLGYPLGLQGPLGLPIWKRASVASEPGTSDPSFMVDTATRPGMSGSPVVQRFRGLFKHDPKIEGLGLEDWIGEGDSFVGVYSGRLGPSQLEAQLGVIWKRHLIDEIIAGQKIYGR